jgi:hypothetical protein
MLSPGSGRAPEPLDTGEEVQMRRRISITVLILLCSFFTLDCGNGGIGCGHCDGGWTGQHTTRVRGSGVIATEARETGEVNDVHLATLGQLHIEMGDREALRIEAEDNLLECLETHVRSGTLTITTRERTNIDPTKPVKYYLTLKTLESISLSSSGDAIVSDIESGTFSISISSSGSLQMGDLSTDILRVRISSSGDVSIENLDAEALHLRISSSGNLAIDGGKVGRQEITISSSGTYHGEDVESARADVRLSSSGSAYLYVTDDLNATLSSSGSVYYNGDPSVRHRVSSSGRIKRMGARRRTI